MSLEDLFPGLLAAAHKKTSPPSPDYNCIAWAAGESGVWWEPDLDMTYYWPPGVPRLYTLEAYVEAFRSIGYVTCESPHLESGFVKIAIFVNAAGEPTHAARQLNDGSWTSKLGQLDDVEHPSLAAASDYGTPAAFLKLEAGHR